VRAARAAVTSFIPTTYVNLQKGSSFPLTYADNIV